MAAGGLSTHGGFVEASTPRHAGRWIGYGRVAAGPFQAFALIDGDRRVCPLAGAVTPVLPDRGQGERVRDLDVAIDGGWTLGGVGRGGPAIPGGGVVYGSWSGDDARTGTLKLGPIATRPDRGLLIPVLGGSGADAGLLSVVDVERGREVARLRPVVGFAGRWVGWRVDMPLDPWPPLVMLVVEDRGQGPGDWLAVGWPRWIE
jgi:hypothetical protein